MDDQLWLEQDPPFGDPIFDPFASAQAGFDHLSTVRLGGRR
jgi:hypothetical protein